MLSKEKAIAVIDYYNIEGLGKITHSKIKSDKQLFAIATDIIENNAAWYRHILRLERRRELQAEINKYDDSWINSKYYKHKTPRLQLPSDVKDRVYILQQELNQLNSELEKQSQRVGRISRKRVTQKKKLYA